MRTPLHRQWLLLLAAGFLTATGAVPGKGSLAWLGLPCAIAANAPRFQTLEQYTRLQIPAFNGSTFRLTVGEGATATLLLDHVSPGALDSLTAWTDSRVAAVEVRTLSVDRAELSIRFKHSGTDAFAYHQGGMVVLDLWRQEKGGSAGVVDVEAKGAAPRAPASVKAPAKKVARAAPPRKRSERKLASLDVSIPAFRAQPLQRERDTFQRYTLTMPELRVENKDASLRLPPDGEIEGLYDFSAGDKTTDDGKAYEFAKSLFAKKNYGLALKTIEISRRDYPKSAYANELRFLEALCYRRLGEATATPALAKKAEGMLRELGNLKGETGQDLPFQRAIQLYLGENDYLAGRWMEAIGHLEVVTKGEGPEAKQFPYHQMMLAECYAQVNEPRRAERIYRYLQEKFPKHPLAAEAAYRTADLLATEKNYPRVVEESAAALKAFPAQEKARSELLFNVGEANFWLGRYAEAEKSFRRFTEIGSAQTNAALAWVRLGEIRELAHGDLDGAREAYLKAKNGYPFSPGDLSATVRLARLNVGAEKEPDFIVKSLRDIQADDKTDEELRRMTELALGPYLVRTGAVEESLDLARKGMAQNEGAVFEAYKANYLGALYGKLLGFAKEKRYGEALALYEKERKWFDGYGPEIFRTLADVYRGLGLYAASNETMQRYAKEAKGRGVASAGGAAALAYAQAKNSFARGAYREALELLPDDEGDADVSAMRAVSEYRLGRKKVAYPLAAAALALIEQDLPEATVLDLMEITLDWNQSDHEFARMEKDLGNAAKRIKGENERLMFAQGDAAWYQKKFAAAEAAYTAALAKFPKGDRADRGRYNLGMSLLSVGKREPAVKLLTELRDSGKSIWAESAKQELELLGWEKKYSSVLKTLPPGGLGVRE